MRVLIIDDDELSVMPLKQDLEAAGSFVVQVGFDDVDKALTDYIPDLVVLDLQDQGEQPTDGGTGKTVYNDIIWPRHYCPVVIYSGFADQFRTDETPLVKAVAKGGEAEAEVMVAIESLRPYTESLSLLRGEIDAVARGTLRDLMEQIAKSTAADDTTKADLAAAMGRRQAAAYLDDQQPSAKLRPESQYVVPPLGNAYRFADLIRIKGAAPDDTSAYRLVLSPSCDLQHHGDGEPRINRVLVANCKEVPWGDGRPTGMPKKPHNSETRRDLKPHLNAGSCNGFVFLPSFLDVIPAMCADLKDMVIISPYSLVDGVSSVDTFERVASVDSPFRERIAWSFVSVAARPGVPDIDVARWVKMYE